MDVVGRDRGFWRPFAVCIAAFLISALLRVVEVQRWDPERHMLGGEYILATHDAYAWVAGAEEIDSRAADHPMARMLRFLSAVTKIPSAKLAFWLPAVLVALSAVPITLWAANLGAPTMAMLAAGVLGTYTPAVFSRTRLGYFDTDWATLFFPVLVSLLIAVWLQANMNDKGLEQSKRGIRRWALYRPMLLLLVIPIALNWHGYIKISIVAMVWIALALLIFKRCQGMGRTVGIDLIAITLATGLGWIGALLGLLLVVFANRLVISQPGAIRLGRMGLWLSVILLLAFSVFQYQDYLIERIPHYFHLNGFDTASLTFPDLARSVRETQGIAIRAALQGIAYQAWLCVLGMLGYIFLAIKRQAALLLTPALLLGLLSPSIGMRFTMFASPVVILGLCVATSWILPEGVAMWGKELPGSQLLFAAVLLIGIPLIQRSYGRFPVETVLEPEHASALRELDSVAARDGLIWTWWDYGYAAQYFAGMPTFADGGRNSGPYLFTLGSVLGDDDIASSAERIRYSAAHDNEPWMVWQGWDPARVDSWFKEDAFSTEVDELPVPQYLVVQWEAISFLPWIQYYGSWNFEENEGRIHAVVKRVQPLELDLEKGKFIDRSGGEVELVSADLLGEREVEHIDFTHQEMGLHLLIRLRDSDVYLLDDQAYRSTLVQLLILPEQLTRPGSGFELIVDERPDARIFEVR